VKIKNSSLSLKKKGVNILVKKTTRMEKKAKSLKLDLNRFFVVTFFFSLFFGMCYILRKIFSSKCDFKRPLAKSLDIHFGKDDDLRKRKKLFFVFTEKWHQIF
jgi:hypothetical protein